jgi:hypothetical protein
MKCINCQTDNNLRDRTANYGRCSRCNHQFAFEPTEASNKYKITDGLFAKLLTDISAEGTISYTNKQLHYQLDRKGKKKSSYQTGGWLISYFLVVWFGTIVLGTFLNILLKGGLAYPVMFAAVNALFIWLIVKGKNNNQDSVSNRRRSIESLKYLGIFLILLAIVQIFSPWAMTAILTLIIGVISIGLHLKQKQKIDLLHEDWGIDRTLFDSWLKKWQTINGRVDRILPPPQSLTIAPNIDHDVTAYSFDRLVVTDRSAIAHFLIANNFHFEHNCAVLSIDEYPRDIFDTVMTMLRRNQDLQVFALHDASPAGVSLVDRLRTSDRWFANQSATIIDLGLLPRQIINGKSGFSVRQKGSNIQAAQALNSTVKQSLSPAEIAWLESGNYVELESFAPLRLLQIVQQGIARSRDLIAASGDDGGLIIFDGSSGDSGAMYAVDSFG